MLKVTKRRINDEGESVWYWTFTEWGGGAGGVGVDERRVGGEKGIKGLLDGK